MMSKEAVSIVERAAVGYAENIAVRASVQTIPWVGGALDTLLSGAGSKIQSERLQQFLSELSIRLEKLETAPEINEEELFDLAVNAMNKAVQASTNRKRSLFAQIMARQIEEHQPIEQAEMALRVVSELESIHLRVLAKVLNAPIAKEPFDGLRVVMLQRIDKEEGVPLNAPVLTEQLNDCPVGLIRLAVAELLSKGLLHDEGIGRWGGFAMQQVVPTETAEWLRQWLS